MINKNANVLLTLKKEGTHLLRRGVYQSAIRKNDVIIAPLVVKKEPEFEEATQILTLGKEFIDHSLSYPTNREGGVRAKKMAIKMWQRKTQRARIYEHCVELALDLHSTIISFEIDE